MPSEADRVPAGQEIPRDAPQALIMRVAGDGRPRYGSGSVGFLAMSPARLRYDFAAVPEQPAPLVVSTIMDGPG